jgi:hypothetical protein
VYDDLGPYTVTVTGDFADGRSETVQKQIQLVGEESSLLSWERAMALPGGLNLNALMWRDSHWIAIGDKGLLRISLDGVTWRDLPTGRGEHFLAMAPDQDRLLLGGQGERWPHPMNADPFPDVLHGLMANLSSDLRSLEDLTLLAKPVTDLAANGETMLAVFFETVWYQDPRVTYSMEQDQLMRRDSSGEWLPQFQGNRLTHLNQVGGSFYVQNQAAPRHNRYENFEGFSRHLISEDGLNWSPMDVPSGLGALFERQGRWFALRERSLWSLDEGGTWQERFSVPSPRTCNDLAWSNQRMVLVGSDGLVATSPDGIQWEQLSLGLEQDLRAVGHNGVLFVAVGEGGSTWYSEDGLMWQNTSTWSHGGRRFNRVRTGSDGFWVLGHEDTVLFSQTGEDWEDQSTGLGLDWLDFAEFNGMNYLLGQSTEEPARRQIWRQGTSWEMVAETTSHEWREMAVQGLVLACASVDQGQLLLSKDGVTWHLGGEVFDPGTEQAHSWTFQGGPDQWIWGPFGIAVKDDLSLEVTRLSPYPVFGDHEGNAVAFSPGFGSLENVAEGPRLWRREADGSYRVTSDHVPFTAHQILWVGDGFLAVGAVGPSLYEIQSPERLSSPVFFSKTGENWEAEPCPHVGTLTRVAMREDRLVAIGENGVLLVGRRSRD